MELSGFPVVSGNEIDIQEFKNDHPSTVGGQRGLQPAKHANILCQAWAVPQKKSYQYQ